MYLKFEMKLMKALSFQTHIIDHTLVYRSLVSTLEHLPEEEQRIFDQLCASDVAYYRSDYYFLLHPVDYAICNFLHQMRLQTSHLRNLDKPMETAIESAQSVFREMLEQDKLLSKRSFKQCLDKYKSFHGRLLSIKTVQPSFKK